MRFSEVIKVIFNLCICTTTCGCGTHDTSSADKVIIVESATLSSVTFLENSNEQLLQYTIHRETELETAWSRKLSSSHIQIKNQYFSVEPSTLSFLDITDLPKSVSIRVPMKSSIQNVISIQFQGE